MPTTINIAPGLLTVDLVLGGLCSLGVWLRRRWPVGLAVTAGLVSVYATSAGGAAPIALFTVAVHRRFAVVAPIAAGCAAIRVRAVPATRRSRAQRPAANSTSFWLLAVIGTLAGLDRADMCRWLSGVVCSPDAPEA